MKKYFAYGSCTNLESFKDTLQKASCNNRFAISGVGRLDNYRLAFTRKKQNGTGALDLIPSDGDYVLGVVYEIPNEAESELDRREGHPDCYKKTNILVKMGDVMVDVFTYVVVDKVLSEVCPSDCYFKTVYEGMKNRFPKSYINKYLIQHCNEKFNMKHKLLEKNQLYHNYHNTKTDFINQNSELYQLLKQITTHLGNDNDIVNTISPSPEDFRLVVKLVEIAARDELDFSHRIVRELFNKLSTRFEGITGLETIKILEY